MHKILTELQRDETISIAIKKFSNRGEFLIFGVNDTLKVSMMAAAFVLQPRPTVILVSDREKIPLWRDDLRELLPDTEILELPEMDLIDVQATTIGLERRAQRLKIFSQLLSGEKIIVLATTIATVKKDFSLEDFLQAQSRIEVGQKLSRENFIEQLISFEYERTDTLESIGQFSVRGGIIDIYPINTETPYRIEFSEDIIDSIRAIDFETRRSVKQILSVSILPLKDFTTSAEPFLNCLGANGTIIFDEPARIFEAVRTLTLEDPDLKQKIFTFEQLVNAARSSILIYLELMMKRVRWLSPTETFGITATNVTNFRGQLKFFTEELDRILDFGQKIFLIIKSETKREIITKLLREKNLLHRVEIISGALTTGFTIPSAKLTVITEQNIFEGQVRRRRRAKFSYEGEQIRHFSDIRPGDYVVHIDSGIGKYIGIETLDFRGVLKDFLSIQYGGNGKLCIPVEQVNQLHKYIGNDDTPPKLSQLGSNEWECAKSRASKAAEDIAEKLLELYARREKAKGFAFDQDDAIQREFEEAFPYEETPDQLKAIADIKRDMERRQPMDRLICGDVGFGKTEIAIRAAFKAAMNGKQCAVLVPTTVLAQQHFQTFKQRFEGFLPTVDVICRFRTPNEQRTTLQKVKAGQVDILIGTHTILSNRIKFKNLGLLIIDEEQRFGVKQKEKIRALSEGVDVLTLSATPIPRTLHMSLAGARDMSLIETPPAERFPVQTYIIEDNDEIVAEAIRREIRRGGQIYFVYNRVETIDMMRERLETLVPEATIRTAHGQMPEDLLEDVMMDFYEGGFNILLSTTIIESGLDVANANTIIVYDAEKFGLAQMYQMRGRVGRSGRMAFAYFVHRANKILSEVAEKRLHALREFAQLGAGFKIAMRDLQIRGAGNLLGAQQHGHIAGVGFEMYCRLLEEAVKKLQHHEEIEIEPEPVINLNVEAFIDSEYISNASDKLEIYRRLNIIQDEQEINDIRDELIDRFGKITAPVENLLLVVNLRILAKNIGIISLKEKNLHVDILFSDLKKISVQGIIDINRSLSQNFQFSEKSKKISLNFATQKNLLIELIDILKKLSPLSKNVS